MYTPIILPFLWVSTELLSGLKRIYLKCVRLDIGLGRDYSKFAFILK